MRRWNNGTTIATGMVMTTAAAAIEPVGCWNCDAPVKKAIAAGTVRALLVDVSEMANTKSLQQYRNTRIAVVKIPGAASGTMTCRKACRGVAPTSAAARSTSHGISRKNAESM